MSQQDYHLAQFSISRAKHPTADERMAGFTKQLPIINQLADQQPGFIWRLQSEQGDSTSFRGYNDPLVFLNMSLWDSVKSLRGFVFKSAHSVPYRNARAWFEQIDGPVTVLWWVKKGHIPTIEEGVARLEAVKYLGSSPYAFGFRGACEPPTADQPLSIVERCAKEVIDLHQYFQDWFRGDIPNSPENQQRFSNSFDRQCELVTPNGQIDGFTDINQRFLAAYKKFPDAKIWTSGFVPILVSDDRVLVKYKEWRQIDGVTNLRVTTCLFTRDDGLKEGASEGVSEGLAHSAPNGVKWFYIHETWLSSLEQAAPAPTIAAANAVTQHQTPITETAISEPA